MPRTAEKVRAYTATYYAKHRTLILARHHSDRRWQQASYKATRRNYVQKNKERIAQQMRKWKDANKDRAKAHQRKSNAKIRSTPEGMLQHRIRTYICTSIKRTGSRKNKRTRELLGCSMEFFKVWIESKFSKGMTWQNRAKWHLDHIRPIVSFNHSDPEEVRKCWHYTNFRPLWKAANILKGCAIIPFPAVNLDLFATHA